MKHSSLPRRTRALTVLAFGAAGALMLAGCGSSGGNGDAAAEGSLESIEAALQKGGEITYWSWTPQAEAATSRASPSSKTRGAVDNAGRPTDSAARPPQEQQ